MWRARMLSDEYLQRIPALLNVHVCIHRPRRCKKDPPWQVHRKGSTDFHTKPLVRSSWVATSSVRQSRNRFRLLCITTTPSVWVKSLQGLAATVDFCRNIYIPTSDDDRESRHFQRHVPMQSAGWRRNTAFGCVRETVCITTCLLAGCKCYLAFIWSNVSQTLLLADPFWLRKIITDPHILAQVNIERPDDRWPKLKMYVSELILDSYEYIAVAYIKMHCMIWP
jgi:hypothetical protein